MSRRKLPTSNRRNKLVVAMRQMSIFRPKVIQSKKKYTRKGYKAYDEKRDHDI